MPERFERAILWASHPGLLFKRLGGVTVLERQLFTAARAGLRAVWIGMRKPERELAGLRLPPGLELNWLPPGKDDLPPCPPPYLGVSGDHLVRVDALKALAAEVPAESVSHEDAAGLAVAQAVVARSEIPQRARRAMAEDSYRRLGSSTDEELVDWLMAAGPKSADGFMARHFDRHISMAVSRALLETRVTPNMMTLASTSIGVLGALLFLGAERAYFVAGSLLVWLHSVLDGCDGELARVRFQESPLGSDLDFWGDNVVHFFLFTSMGVGFWLSGRGELPLLLSAAAAGNVAASSWMAWKHRLARRAGARMEAGVTDQAGFIARLQNALAQRDFIYLLVVLAFIDRVYEFLWASAIGGVLYFATMLHLKRGTQNEEARQPHPAGQG